MNQIFNEDCFITIDEHIKQYSVDCVLTSPPYNMTKRKGGISDSGRYDVYIDWKTEDEYIEFSVNLFDKLNRVIKENGTILYNLSFSKENPILPTLVVSAIHQQTEWTLVDKIIWEKHSAIPSPADRLHHTRKCEMIYGVATEEKYDEVSFKVSDKEWVAKFYDKYIKNIKGNPMLAIYEVRSLND